ncbi:MAG: alcohol dehydrogenase catalytic domain-containing protein [Clostridiales bacterium]|nr:alcohol dehydrogenase catalytic domain-containing protein [Clostridiales bacterium]
MKNRCFYLDSQHHFTMKEESVPVPATDEAVVLIRANGICGSDIHFFKDGRLGNFVVTQPYVPGHECSGEVYSVGSNAGEIHLGDFVAIEPGIPCGYCGTCKSGRYNLCPNVTFLSEPGVNGTFCDYVKVRSDMLHPLRKGMDFELGALAEPVAVAAHAMSLAGKLHGKTGAVFGAGPIGLLTMLAFKASGGGRAICIDINERRLMRAKELGADEVILNCDADLKNICDVSFETAGSPITTAQLFAATRTGGHAVQIGWPAGNVVPMDISALMEKEITYSGLNRYANAFPVAIAWLADGRIPGKLLITHHQAFEQTPQAFSFTADHPNEVVKMMVTNK